MARWKWIRARCLHVSTLGRLRGRPLDGRRGGREWLAISPYWYSFPSSLELAHGGEALMWHDVEGKHRLFVYEFLKNGSLDNFLFSGQESSDGRFLNWARRYDIA
ncbi:hypothetical protein ACS0TY_028203 [Phlomoides rotata]